MSFVVALNIYISIFGNISFWESIKSFFNSKSLDLKGNCERQVTLTTILSISLNKYQTDKPAIQRHNEKAL